MYAIMPKESHKNKDKKNMGRIYYMKHRNKIQILGLGLAWPFLRPAAHSRQPEP